MIANPGLPGDASPQWLKDAVAQAGQWGLPLEEVTSVQGFYQKPSEAEPFPRAALQFATAKGNYTLLVLADSIYPDGEPVSGGGAVTCLPNEADVAALKAFFEDRQLTVSPAPQAQA